MLDNVHRIFTHNDLDGAVSLLVFIWSKPNDTITFDAINNTEVDKIKNYIDRTLNPPNIYVFDLSLREFFLNALDKPFITFIDHHKNSEKFLKDFKKATVFYKEYSSNALLLRKLFQEKSPELTKEQKKMILLADDYDSFKLNFEESFDLNILFWTEYKNNIVKFVNDYKNGFKPFTEEQKNKIKNIKIITNNEIEKLPKFLGTLEIKGIKRNTMGILTESLNNLAIDLVLKKYNPDLLFYINHKTQNVALRQKKDENCIDLGKFAEKFCEGSGHMYSAGGKITPLFMELTKNLKPL